MRAEAAAPSLPETRRFSVVMPVYNGERFLAEAIESVLAQSLRPLEIIVVDDGSTDGTRAVAERYLESITFLTQPNAGPSAARNRGVAAARGAWIAFLDSDDRWEPGYLLTAAAYLAAHPGAGLLCFGVRILTEAGAPTPEVILKKTPGETYTTTDLLEGEVGTICTPLVRRDLFLAAGGFDETLRGNEDCHLWLRLSLVTELHQTPEPLLLYRRHPGNTSGDILENARESVRSLELLDQSFPQFREEFRDSMEKIRGKEYLRLGRELLVRAGPGSRDLAEARRALGAAVRCRPGRLRGWIYLGVAYIPGGAPVFARWRRLELKLRRTIGATEVAASFRKTMRRARAATLRRRH